MKIRTLAGVAVAALVALVIAWHRPAGAQTTIPGLAYGAVTLAAATATKVPTPDKSLNSRKGIGLANLDAATIYCGGDSAVTASNGWPVFSQAKDGLGAGFAPNYGTTIFYGQLWCFSAAGTIANGVRWIEVR